MPLTRLLVCSLGGLLAGLACYGLASSGPAPLAMPVALQIVASRTLIGVAIGLSRFTFGHWALHGALLGALFSIPLAISGLMAPENPEFTPTMMVVSTIVMGMIYGLLIEVVASVILRLRVPAASATAAQSRMAG